jgi:hypothetical protein
MGDADFAEWCSSLPTILSPSDALFSQNLAYLLQLVSDLSGSISLPENYASFTETFINSTLPAAVRILAKLDTQQLHGDSLPTVIKILAEAASASLRCFCDVQYKPGCLQVASVLVDRSNPISREDASARDFSRGNRCMLFSTTPSTSPTSSCLCCSSARGSRKSFRRIPSSS